MSSAAQDNGPISPPLTASTKNFRESVHLIPSIKREERPKSYEPPQMKLWVILPAGLFMISLGIALEVALSISERQTGFHVKEENVFKFASAQFLTSFFPVLLVVPLGLLWESKAWLVKRYQPYINLAKGNARAEDSLLLDYISTNSLYSIFLSLWRRHWLVFIAAIAGLLKYLLQPLASAIFSVAQVPKPSPSSVYSIRALGLDPDRFQLTAFLAAAGYVLAAVSNNLLDPPFVRNNWVTADFTFPTSDYLNGSMTTNTVGIRTNATCFAPASLSISPGTSQSTFDAQSGPDFIVNGTSSTCPVTVTFDPNDADQQYGVSPVENCGTAPGTNQTFLPVFFWFYRNNGGIPEAGGVFCSPTLEVFRVAASASLNNGSLEDVEIIAPIDNYANNNVTGVPQNGLAFNGVIFDEPPDEFTAVRANATRNGVPGAILRSVQLNGSEAEDAAFGSPDGFLEPTSRIYTQHLALVAKNTYFLPVNNTLQATVISLKPRLVIEPLAAHALSTVLIIMGLIMLIVGVVHHRMRRGIFLAAPPGSIASAVALTSHSGFGTLIVPYDTEMAIQARLAPLRFRLDERTGAIIASDAPGYDFVRGDDSDQEDGEKILSRGSTTRTAVSNTQEQNRLLGSSRESSIAPLAKAGYTVEPFSPPAQSSDPEKQV